MKFFLSLEKSIYNNEELTNEEVFSFSRLDNTAFRHFQNNILYYIAGNAAYKFIEKYPCSCCEDIILNENTFSKDHNYSLISIKDYVCFTNFKNWSNLKFVSVFIFD